MTGDTEFFRFGVLARPVAFVACPEAPAAIAARLNGWDISPWPPQGGPWPTAAVTLAKRGSAFFLTSDLIDGEETYDDLPDAVCAFMAELIMAHGAGQSDTLFLHAGGAQLGGNLFIYPAKGKAGKSTLTAQLAAAGARIFSDDVLPLDLTTGHVSALGIDPRLRLPLPDALPAATRRWIEQYICLNNHRLTYLNLPRSGPGALARHGETASIGAFVLLDRSEDASPELAPCPRADIMKLVINQHFGSDAPMTQILSRFKAVIEPVPCWRLRYTGGDQAVTLLLELAART